MIWLWWATVIALAILWEYRILRRAARYKQWRLTYLPWLDQVETEQTKFDPTWPKVPSA